MVELLGRTRLASVAPTAQLCAGDPGPGGLPHQRPCRAGAINVDVPTPLLLLPIHIPISHLSSAKHVAGRRGGHGGQNGGRHNGDVNR